MRRGELAAATRLTAPELTRALKSARQMGVVHHQPQADGIPLAETPLALTGRPLPPARRASLRSGDTALRFQPLLDVWGITRPASRAKATAPSQSPKTALDR